MIGNVLELDKFAEVLIFVIHMFDVVVDEQDESE